MSMETEDSLLNNFKHISILETEIIASK